MKTVYKFIYPCVIAALLTTGVLICQEDQDIPDYVSQDMPDDISIEQAPLEIETSLSSDLPDQETISVDTALSNQTTKTSPGPVIISPDDETDRNLTDYNLPIELQGTDHGEQKESMSRDGIGDDERIELHFEDADIENLVKQISELYKVTFIPDESVTKDGKPITGKALKGNKISFKTHKPLTKQEAWNLFITFLDLAGLAIVPQPDPTRFRITSTDTAKKSPIQSYIGVDATDLPDSDQLVRYVYFVVNSGFDVITKIVEDLRSSTSNMLKLEGINAFVLTDKSYNIKSLMKIVTELDTVTLPQSMSVLKLKKADAQDVKKLYDSLTQGDEKSITARLFPARKSPTALYFPENARIIAEPRTNSLILLGTQDAINRIEEFVTTYVDVDLGKPYSPLRTYTLKNADATAVANIMNDVLKFGKETEAGKAGGVRGDDKFFKPMSFTPEKETNRLIIRGDEEDYLRVKDVLAKLDEQQPEVAIQVLILSVNIKDAKRLGAQIRSKELSTISKSGILGQNVEFQTSGINLSGQASSIKLRENTTAGPGASRLLADLINLVTGGTIGNTVISLGSDAYGIWGIFHALETISNTQIISNPFLVATNKKQAIVSVGERRRVISAKVVGSTTQNSFTNQDADLKVTITPQINSDGKIVMTVDIDFAQFTDPTTVEDPTRLTKKINTTTIVADREVLALGGLIQNKISNSITKTPILGNIPILGWFFRNKAKEQTKDNLLVLISAHIMRPDIEKDMLEFTQERIDGYKGDMGSIKEIAEHRDPVHRFFFADQEGRSEKVIDDFIFKRHKKGKSRRSRKLTQNKKKRESKYVAQTYKTPGVKVLTPSEDLIEPTLTTAAAQPNEKPAPIIRRTKPSLSDMLSKNGGVNA